MKITFLVVGKSHERYVNSGVEEFTQRISKFYPVDWVIIPAGRVAGSVSGKDSKKECEAILQWLKKEDYLVALDEKGNQLSSLGIAEFIQSRANESVKRLVFLIGGAFGLDNSILQRANFQWSLSKLTFPHQMVRLILAEQIYRACTILRNEKYHHG